MEALLFVIKNPVETLKLLFVNHRADSPHFDGLKTKFYLVFGFSGGLLLFVKPWYFLPMVPLVAKKMFNDDALRWDHEMYYSIEVATILPFLVFSIISDFRAEVRSVTSIAVATITLVVTIVCFRLANYPGISGQEFNFYAASFYHSELDLKAIHSALRKIPDTARVSAPARVIPQVALRGGLSHFPSTENADYICAIVNGDSYPVSQGRFDSTLTVCRNNHLWVKEFESDNFIILKRVSLGQ